MTEAIVRVEVRIIQAECALTLADIEIAAGRARGLDQTDAIRERAALADYLADLHARHRELMTSKDAP